MSYFVGNNLAAVWWLLAILVILRWFNSVASDPGRQIGDSELGLAEEDERARCEASLPRIPASSRNFGL